MKNIYIVLTYTGIILSKVVKLYTKREYSHSSISLNLENVKLIYQGKLNKYNVGESSYELAKV